MANHWHPATATSASSCTNLATKSADARFTAPHDASLTQPSLSPKSLLDSCFYHDSCGVGFVARVSNQPSHEVLEHALQKEPVAPPIVPQPEPKSKRIAPEGPRAIH